MNVNLPAINKESIQGIVITRQGKGRFEEKINKSIDPVNGTYYHFSGQDVILDTDKDVDDIALKENNISITPLRFDLTDMTMIEELKRWNLEK